MWRRRLIAGLAVIALWFAASLAVTATCLDAVSRVDPLSGESLLIVAAYAAYLTVSVIALLAAILLVLSARGLIK